MQRFRKLTYLETYIKPFKWFFNKVTYSFFLFSSVLIIIITSEFLLYKYNNDNKYPFLMDIKKITKSNYEHDFYGLDPLLGWGIDTSKLKENIIKENSVYLENLNGVSNDTLTIFITGGSTSDIILLSYNWPVLLSNKLKQEKINFKIFVGSIGGFGLSQEILKLIRDGLKIEDLDIHISYFGANEYQDTYVTVYENELYNNLNKNWFLLPNIKNAIDKYILNNNTTYVVPRKLESEGVTTYKNLKIMKSVSNYYDYIFIPIFQPLVGLGSLHDAYKTYKLENHESKGEIKKMINLYQQNYNALIKMDKYDELNVVDFTKIFDKKYEYPFYDDCHVKENLQHIISDSIFNVIFQKVDVESFKKRY